jgi:ketosteroid isomerase-like protein
MKLSHSVFLLSLLFSPPLFAQQDDESQIIENVQQMWTAVSENDLEKYLSYIHPDYSVFGEGDVYLHEGKAKERIDYADYLGRASGVRTFMHQPKVTVRGDTAWLTYHWNDAGYIKGERFTSRGKSTRLFVKEDGKWLCIHSHFTAIP